MWCVSSSVCDVMWYDVMCDISDVWCVIAVAWCSDVWYVSINVIVWYAWYVDMCDSVICDVVWYASDMW
jgi:hypothetical protein